MDAGSTSLTGDAGSATGTVTSMSVPRANRDAVVERQQAVAGLEVEWALGLLAGREVDLDEHEPGARVRAREGAPSRARGEPVAQRMPVDLGEQHELRVGVHDREVAPLRAQQAMTAEGAALEHARRRRERDREHAVHAHRHAPPAHALARRARLAECDRIVAERRQVRDAIGIDAEFRRGQRDRDGQRGWRGREIVDEQLGAARAASVAGSIA